MYVYSGKCREGLCGEKTNLINIDEKPLFVGDIVMSSTIDKQGIHSNYGLSVVVSDRYTSYSNGNIEESEKYSFFVMGIKSCKFNLKEGEEVEGTEWIVERLKSFEDVIDGEHWKDFGFNYKEV